MSPTLGQKFLRLVSPKFEEQRVQDRIAISQMLAYCEDINRTVKSMNGHVSDHPLVREWNSKKPSST